MALFSSYCTPNAKCLHIDDPVTLEKGITVLAQTHVPAGEEISIQYNRKVFQNQQNQITKWDFNIHWNSHLCRLIVTLKITGNSVITITVIPVYNRIFSSQKTSFIVLANQEHKERFLLVLKRKLQPSWIESIWRIC